MKKISFAYILFFFLVMHTAQAQNAFQGVIHLSSASPLRDEKAGVSWSISGGNHRLDFDTQTKEGNYKYSLIWKTGSTDVILLTPGPEKNLYYKIPLSGFPKSAVIPAAAQVNETEGRKLVAGYNCREYLIRSSENSASVWVGNIQGFSAEDIPAFLKNNGILGALKFHDIAGIPLEFVIFNQNQEIVASQAMLGIQRQTVQPGIFEIPPGYEAGN